MIDMSCLTEEEQEMILAVLRRDAKLNEIEEQRIKKLKKTERDKRKLKYLTGEWFYETKSSRHRDKIHGTDLIRSSITQRKPVTILELTQIWPEKPSILKNETKDVFVPPELSGLIPDLSSTSGDNRADHCQVVNNKVAYPQIKPRKNPFNSKPVGSESTEKTDEHLRTDGVPSTEQQLTGDLNRVPKESPLVPVKAGQTLQIPAEDHHEDYPEPCTSQVSEHHDIPLVQGKEEGQSQVPTEGEESPINKVLGWFGRKERSKAKERPDVLIENKEDLESHESPDVENTPEAEEIKEKPSSKPRRGLLTLLSRQKTTSESPENKLTKENLVCPPDDIQDHVFVECQIPDTPLNPELDDHNDVQNFSSEPNMATDEHEQLPELFITEDDDTTDDIAGEESLDKGDKSQNRLVSLKSFWERRTKGTTILKIKKGLDGNCSEQLEGIKNENKTLDQKMSEDHEQITISPLEAKTIDSTEDVHSSSEDFCKQHNGNKNEHNVTVSPSSSEKMLSFTMNQKLQEHEESPTTLNNEIPTPIPSIRKALIQKNTEPATHCERSGPNIIISSHDCIPDVNVIASPRHHSQQGIILNNPPLDMSPTSIDPGRFFEAKISSLNKEVGMMPTSSKEKGEKSPTTVPSACSTNKSDSNENKKLIPRSLPFQNAVLGITDDKLEVTELVRAPTPRHIPKVPAKELFPVKRPRKVLSLRAFPIDISPTQNIQVDRLVCLPTCRDLSSYPLGPSRVQKMRDCSGLAERPELHHMSLSACTSKQNPDYPVTYQQSSLNLGRSQSPRQISIGDINRKELILARCSPECQSQTSVQLLPSSQHHRKTLLEGNKERKQQDSTQPNICLVQSYISSSSQHNSSSPEFTSISRVLDPPAEQKGASVQVIKSSDNGSQPGKSNDDSPSGQSHPESEMITYESGSSTSPEALSPSRTGSAHGTDSTSLVRTSQKQLTVRPLSISKSLEDISTLPSKDERWNNDPGIEITLSAEDAPNTLMPVLDPEQTKRLSCSVPDFLPQQDNDEESDGLSVNIFHSDRRRKSSTNTNISASSGLASMSSGSVMNIYGAEFGHAGVRGTIQFAINYVPKLGELQVFVVQCRDLAAAEPKRNRSDPYVKCYLLPDKTKLDKRKTSVKKKTLNPIFNEILRYKIALESLKVHTLNVSVWHNDTFGRNSFLGEVDVDLSDWDFNNTHMMDCELKERFSTPSSPTRGNHNMEVSGEMNVALRFFLHTSQSNKTVQTGEVQIWVKKCKNLPASGGTIDPFVKCSLLPDTNQKSRQKTRVVKKTTNPEFNHTMVFGGVRPEDLCETSVELTVWDHDRLSNHFIGGTRFSLGTGKIRGTKVNWMDSNSCEAELWKTMIESKNEWVEDTVPLRMLIMAKTVSR